MNRFKCWRSTRPTNRKPPELVNPKFSFKDFERPEVLTPKTLKDEIAKMLEPTMRVEEDYSELEVEIPKPASPLESEAEEIIRNLPAVSPFGGLDMKSHYLRSITRQDIAKETESLLEKSASIIAALDVEKKKHKKGQPRRLIYSRSGRSSAIMSTITTDVTESASASAHSDKDKETISDVEKSLKTRSKRYKKRVKVESTMKDKNLKKNISGEGKSETELADKPKSKSKSGVKKSSASSALSKGISESSELPFTDSSPEYQEYMKEIELMQEQDSEIKEALQKYALEPDITPSQIPVAATSNLNPRKDFKDTPDINWIEADPMTRVMPVGLHITTESDIINGVKHAAICAADYIDKYLVVNVRTEDQIFSFATRFACGDTWSAGKIAEAIDQFGKKPQFMVCKGKDANSLGDKFSIKHGIVLRPGYKSPCYLDNTDGGRYTRPIVLIVNVEISNFKNLKKIIADVKKTNRELILIARSLTLNVLRQIHSHNLNKLPVQNRIIPVCFSKEFLKNNALVEDFGLIVGAKVCELEDLYPDNWTSGFHFGSAADVIVTKEDICFIITKGRAKLLRSVASSYFQVLKDSNFKEDRNLLKKRIRLLLNKVCLFETGGQWKDVQKRIGLLKEAIAKTMSAYRRGVVPGGGNSLIKCTNFPNISSINERERMGYALFQHQVMYHFAKYVGSAGNAAEIAETVKYLPTTHGFDNRTNEFCDLIERGLIEPVMYVKMELYQLYRSTLNGFFSKAKLKELN